VRALLARALDWRRIPAPIWLAAAVLTMPLAILASLLLTRPPGPWVDASALAAPLMFVVFFVGGLGEELGWSGYATEPLAARWGALRAALLIGVVWAAWHIIPFLQGGRSWDWIAWQGLKSVAARVVMVWLFFQAGRSVLAVTVFHAMSNVSEFGTVGGGALYDPATTALVLGALAVVVAVLFRLDGGAEPAAQEPKR
jgi:membrane protease YdiL (CAAX protease family)